MPKSAPETTPKPPSPPDQHRLALLLRHAWYGLNQAFRRRILHLDLTPDQYTVLRTLSENRDLCQKDLTRLMASDPNTIASLLERMARSGLVERKRRTGDRRVFHLRLRPAGRRKFKAAQTIASQLQSEVLDGVRPLRQGRFLCDLAAIAAACQAATRRLRT